jgi:hypothetical protein
VPLILPLTLLKHHLNRYPVPEWVHQRVYLHPYPKELMLRNHVQVQALWAAETSKDTLVPSNWLCVRNGTVIQ